MTCFDAWRVCQTGAMHRVPIERAGYRMIDPDKVCEAIGALLDEDEVRTRARRFSLLGDLTRMRLLLCIQAAGPISVSDLTAATGLQGDTVSQTLRFLRAHQTVTAERDGRVIRYRLADPVINDILAYSAQLATEPAAGSAQHERT